jgi:hypothetical protein
MKNHLCGLGRRRVYDSRDEQHLIRSILPEKLPEITSKYWSDRGYWGDQGNTSMCTGYAMAHWLENSPITHKSPPPVLKPDYIYHEAQKIDEWPGEDYEGTSVRACAKVLQREGYISSYKWAFDLQTTIDAVLMKGPVVIGSTWYENMFSPDASGVIHVGGSVAGGHAYLINGVNTKTKYFRIKQSWGRSWGNKGHAYISFYDLETLILDAGEVMLGVEVDKN